MSGILASMIDGLLIGSVYGLAAMGLSLIWGVMDVINLTHGAVIALGMFGMYILFAAFPVVCCSVFLFTGLPSIG
jgi:branched-chain amino acid transport system permease protein